MATIRVKRYRRKIRYPFDKDSPYSLNAPEREGRANDKIRAYSYRIVKSRSQVQRKRFVPWLHEKRSRKIRRFRFDPMVWDSPERREHLDTVFGVLRALDVKPHEIKADYTVKPKRKRGGQRKQLTDPYDIADFITHLPNI